MIDCRKNNANRKAKISLFLQIGLKWRIFEVELKEKEVLQMGFLPIFKMYFPDELLYSWLWRLAKMNHLSMSNF